MSRRAIIICDSSLGFLTALNALVFLTYFTTIVDNLVVRVLDFNTGFLYLIFMLNYGWIITECAFSALIIVAGIRLMVFHRKNDTPAAEWKYTLGLMLIAVPVVMWM